MNITELTLDIPNLPNTWFYIYLIIDERKLVISTENYKDCNYFYMGTVRTDREGKLVRANLNPTGTF